jgi:TM2 domain-containing membrane protein YozV
MALLTTTEKNKDKAVKLAVTLGWLGGHRFYTGQTISAVAYLLFFWTLVPGVLSLIDAFFLARMTDDDFSDEFCPLQVSQPISHQRSHRAGNKDSAQLTA